VTLTGHTLSGLSMTEMTVSGPLIITLFFTNFNSSECIFFSIWQYGNLQLQRSN